MVHVMHPDMTCEPCQSRRKFVVGASLERRFVKAPVAVVSPKRILELMLDIEEPYGDRGAYDHHRRLHEKKWPDPHQPDQHRRDAGDRRIGSHCA